MIVHHRNPCCYKLLESYVRRTLKHTEDEGESSISNKKNENDDENENATNRTSKVDSTAENWEQVMKPWNGADAGGQVGGVLYWLKCQKQKQVAACLSPITTLREQPYLVMRRCSKG